MLDQDQKLQLVNTNQDHSINGSIQTVAFDPLYDTVPNLDTPHAQTKSGPTSGYKKVI